MELPPAQPGAQPGQSGQACCARRMATQRLLDDSRRTDVRPDSVQVIGGRLSMRLPTDVLVWLAFGLRPAGHRDEAWLKKGLPCS